MTKPGRRAEAIRHEIGCSTFAKPVHAEILDADAKLASQPLDVVVAEDAEQVAVAVERRVADDHARRRPLHAQRVCSADRTKPRSTAVWRGVVRAEV
jgi:hypothetical protein